LHEAASRYLESDWQNAGKFLDEAIRGAGGAYNSTLLLMRARCFQQRAQWADVVRTAGTLLQKVDSRGAWVRGQPRMMVVTLGATAAMEMGDGEKALKFYQTCLRNDPDQKDISKQYKGLKKLLKLIKEVDEQLAKSQNHKALATLDEALSGMKGMDVNSGLFRSGLLLRQCRGYSELKRHEEALMACDQSVQRRSEPVSGMFVDPKKLSESLSIRAKSHMLDKNYDEAVKDLRQCIELIGQTEEFNQRLHEAQMAQRQWANQRNHREVLELPVNLHQLSKDKQCSYIKKAHKTLARKWHPDKAKGNKVCVCACVCVCDVRTCVCVCVMTGSASPCAFVRAREKEKASERARAHARWQAPYHDHHVRACVTVCACMSKGVCARER
jgi:tetratricopeptide (TPR) repeat protein